jgi:hypothetical protein
MKKATFLVDGKSFSYVDPSVNFFIKALQDESKYLTFVIENGTVHCLNKNYISAMIVEEVE